MARYIQKIRIENVLAFEEAEFDLNEHGAIVRGGNGVGKTSILDALRTAFGGRKTRTEMVRKGAEEGRVLLVMDDGSTISRTVRDERMGSPEVRTPDGERMPRPKQYLSAIAPAMRFNPIQFIEMDARKQAEVLAEAFPVQLDEEELRRLTRDQVRIDDLPQDMNPLEKATEVRKRAEERLREIRATKRALADQQQALNGMLPADFDPNEARRLNSRDLADRLARGREHNRKVQDARRTLAGLDERARHLEAEIKRLQEELASVQARVQEGREWIERNPEIDLEPMERSLAALDEQRKWLGLHDQLTEVERQREQAGSAERVMDNVVRNLKELPGLLVQRANIPIEGLTIEDGVVRVNGIPVSDMSEGEQLELACKVAVAGAGDLRVLCVDGAERLSPETRDRLVGWLEEQGIQVFMTEVDEGALRIEPVSEVERERVQEKTPHAGNEEPAEPEEDINEDWGLVL